MRKMNRTGYSEIGRLIKRRLIDKDMTATELAMAIGVKPQYLNSILHGQRSGKKYLAQIGEVLDIEIIRNGETKL